MIPLRGLLEFKIDEHVNTLLCNQVISHDGSVLLSIPVHYHDPSALSCTHAHSHHHSALSCIPVRSSTPVHSQDPSANSYIPAHHRDPNALSCIPVHSHDISALSCYMTLIHPSALPKSKCSANSGWSLWTELSRRAKKNGEFELALKSHDTLHPYCGRFFACAQAPGPVVSCSRMGVELE